MDNITNTEAWRQISPEEKLDMMAEAQKSGILSALTIIVIGATFSIAYQWGELFWISILCTPVVFQYSTMKRWRALRPKLLLTYLAARSAARRYAYAVKSMDMTVRLIFQGELQAVPNEDEALGALDAAITGYKKRPVWIALFSDSVVIISEAQGGAKLEFGNLINERLEMRKSDPEISDENALLISYDDRSLGKYTVKLTSHLPGAFSVFETTLQGYIDSPKESRFDADALEQQIENQQAA